MKDQSTYLLIIVLDPRRVHVFIIEGQCTGCKISYMYLNFRNGKLLQGTEMVESFVMIISCLRMYARLVQNNYPSYYLSF